jgi:magnesium transporter
MLVNCIAYQDGKKLADILVSEISSYVHRPDCFVWVALKDATQDELETARVQFGLHELAVEDARVGVQRPKIEEYGDSIFTVLHLIEMEERELHVGEIDVFVGHNDILSVRTRSKQGFIGVRDRCEREPQLLKHGSGFVLYALIDAVVDRYFPIIDALETELEEIEEGIFDQGTARLNTQRLYALKQKVMVMKHAVAPLTEAVGKLYGGRVPQICMGTQEYFRDVYDHLIRMNTVIDTIRDTIVTAIQVNLSVVAIEDNEVMKRLGAWAGIFAVATFFVGVWGMNFKNMPELDWIYGYPFALSIIGIACFTMYRVFRRAGWL